MDPCNKGLRKTIWGDIIEEVSVNGLSSSTKYIDEGNKMNVVSACKIKEEQESVAKCLNATKLDDSSGSHLKNPTVSQELFMGRLCVKKIEPESKSILDLTSKNSKCLRLAEENPSVNCANKDTTTDDKTVMENKATVASTASKEEQEMQPSLQEAQKSSTPRKRIVRISNLSERITETDLDELVKDIGPCKTYLALDMKTGLCKGSADLHFQFYDDASAAIAILDGLLYDNVILNARYPRK